MARCPFRTLPASAKQANPTNRTTWRTRLRSHGLGVLFGLIALLVSIAGADAASPRHASRAPVHGGTLSLAWASDMLSFDPAHALIYDWQIMNGTLYNGLYQFDRNGAPQLDLAAAPPTISSDRKTWTFHLRKGVLFSNGMEVTADDVKFSITRVLDPHLKPAVSWGQYTDAIFQGAQDVIVGKATSVSGIQALDRYTVRFVLTAPVAVFPDILAESFNFVVPKAVVTKESPDYFASHPVGTGPFVLQSWQKGTKVVFARNPRYFKTGKPYLDKIIAYVNVSPSTIALKVEKGELSGFGTDGDLTAADLQQARNDPTYRRYLVNAPSTSSFWLTQNIHSGPLSSLPLRQAIAMAIDRGHLIKVLGGNAFPSHQFYIHLDPQYDTTLDQHPAYAYDVQKAAALVKTSGYHGQPITLAYANDAPYYVSMALAIQQELQQIGLNLTLRGVSGNAFQSLSAPLNGTQLALTGWSIDFPDAYDVYAGGLSCVANAAGSPAPAHYCDQQADSLTTRAEALPLGSERDALLRQAQARLLQSAAYTPLVYLKRVEMVSPKVSGFYYQPQFVWQFENYSLNS